MQFFTFVLMIGAILVMWQVLGNARPSKLIPIWIGIFLFVVLTQMEIMPNILGLEFSGPLNATNPVPISAYTNQDMRAVCPTESYYDSRSGTCTITPNERIHDFIQVWCKDGTMVSCTSSTESDCQKTKCAGHESLNPLICPRGTYRHEDEVCYFRDDRGAPMIKIPSLPKGTYSCTKIDGAIKWKTCKQVR